MKRPARRFPFGRGVAILLALLALVLLPQLTRRDDVLNFAFLILLAITLAESWNILAGYAGQVNLGHSAFFGLGALVARSPWIGGNSCFRNSCIRRRFRATVSA